MPLGGGVVSDMPNDQFQTWLKAYTVRVRAEALREAADLLAQVGPLARVVAHTENITLTTAAEWLRAVTDFTNEIGGVGV